MACQYLDTNLVAFLPTFIGSTGAIRKLSICHKKPLRPTCFSAFHKFVTFNFRCGTFDSFDEEYLV